MNREATPEPSPPRTRFVRVIISPKRNVDDAPGLLLGWRRSVAGWEAHVAYVNGVGGLIVDWLPSDRIRPADEAARGHEPDRSGRLGVPRMCEKGCG